MRILFVSKRQYTNKDLLDDRYGRLRELPLQLAQLGHQVIGSCLSYKEKSETPVKDSGNHAEVDWHSFNAGSLKIPGLIRYFFNTYRLGKEFQPDVIIAASDSIYGIVGMALSRLLATPFVFDLYDNFESFGAIKFPLVRRFYTRAIRKADLLTVVSKPLKEHVSENYSRQGPTIVIENGVDPELFRPMLKAESRKALGLPIEAKIIGVTGAISHTRGIDLILRAHSKLLEKDSNVLLVMAGKVESDVKIDKSPNIILLGELPHNQIPQLVSCLDVSIVSNIDSPFGRYCYPQKFVETVACRIAPVVASVGAMQQLLGDFPDILFKPGNVDDLVRAIDFQLQRNYVPENLYANWENLAENLNSHLVLLRS